MKIFRGNFVFIIKDGIIKIYEGGKNVPQNEWEFVATFHEDYLDNMIAGLTAIKQHR